MDPLSIPFGPLGDVESWPDSPVFEVPDGREFVAPPEDELRRVLDMVRDDFENDTLLSLCPEHDERAAMPEHEFWERVANNLLGHQHHPYDYEPDEDFVDEIAVTCPECGASGACGYDQEGRPMIHTTSQEDD